jgi:hypothetical protein
MKFFKKLVVAAHWNEIGFDPFEILWIDFRLSRHDIFTFLSFMEVGLQVIFLRFRLVASSFGQMLTLRLIALRQEIILD